MAFNLSSVSSIPSKPSLTDSRRFSDILILERSTDESCGLRLRLRVDSDADMGGEDIRGPSRAPNSNARPGTPQRRMRERSVSVTLDPSTLTLDGFRCSRNATIVVL
jgi:hypothetical protein